MGFDRLNLSVRSLGETARWYRRVFGFEPVEEGTWDGVPWAILRSGDSMLCVYERPELGAPEGDGKHHRVRHAGFRIRDRAEWEAVLTREGVESEYREYPHSDSWYVTDPTGYEIEVVHWKDGCVRFPSFAKERS
jgi:catechol 2,3-dioxygenase-like lactoylglutathione lyase family enzyme